jgi:hypothetical protein
MRSNVDVCRERSTVRGRRSCVRTVNRAQSKDPLGPVDGVRCMLGREPVNLGVLAQAGRKHIFDDRRINQCNVLAHALSQERKATLTEAASQSAY